MKPRTLLTAREVEALREQIARRLDRVAIETQPEVAAAVLDLACDPGVGLSNFAGVIRGDSALAARVLRQANTAYFRQADPVIDVDRACIVLGADRLRAVALGFTLDRAGPRSPERRLSRRTWRDSMIRACIAAALCDRVCDRHAPGAFVVGLMLDAAQPILARLLGKAAMELLSAPMPPHVAFAAEQRSLPFTHVDVAAVMCDRWRLPASLSAAIEHHHAAPPPLAGFSMPRDEVSVLRRVGHVAGLVELDDRTGVPRAGDWLPRAAERTLGLSGAELSSALMAAQREFASMRQALPDGGQSAADPAELTKRIQRQVNQAIDQMLAGAIRRDDPAGPKSIRLGGRVVEIECAEDGRWSAVLTDSLGDRIAMHEINSGDSVARVMDGLALVPVEGDQLDALSRILGLVA